MKKMSVSEEAEYVDKIINPDRNIDFVDIDAIVQSRTNPGSFHWFYFDKLYSVLKNAKPCKVLDVACGVGFLSVYLAKQGHKVIAVDISKNSIASAEKLASSNNCIDKIDFHVMDVSRLDLDADSFDIVTGEDALHHIIKYKGAIENIYRVLKPGGKVFFTEPFAFNPLINVMRDINVKIRKHKGEQFLGRDEMRSLNNCFDEIKITDKSVLYILSRFFNKQSPLNKKINIFLKNTDDRLQSKFPFISRYYAYAFLEMTKKNR